MPDDISQQAFKLFSFMVKKASPPTVVSSSSTKLDSPPPGGLLPPRLKYLDTPKKKLQYLQRFWTTIVEVYTRGRLTFSGDKLIAVSGIAKEMRLLMNDEYFAGLWRRDMVSQLIWSVYSSSDNSHRPAEYRAPSWSWASVDGPVNDAFEPRTNWDKYQVTELSEVLDVHVTHATDDDTGSVSAGHVRLRGPLKKAYIRISEFPWWLGTDQKGTRHLIVGGRRANVYLEPDVRWTPRQGARPDFDPEDVSPEIADRWLQLTAEKRMAGIDFLIDQLAEVKIPVRNMEPADKVLYFLPLMKAKGGSGDPLLQGLVLEPTEGSRGEYRRFGKFRTTIPINFKIWEGVDHGGVDKEHYLAYDGKRDYTISIV